MKIFMRNWGRELYKIPIPVVFQGFFSDTVALMQSGWDISVDQDYHRDCLRFAFRLRSINMYGLSGDFNLREFFDTYSGMMNRQRYNEDFRYRDIDKYARGYAPMDRGHMPIMVNHIASEIEIRQYGGPSMNFNPLADPHLYFEGSPGYDRYYASKRPWFETVEVKQDDTIFFEGHEVPDLLAGILKKQEEKQKEIREKMRKANKETDYKVSAQIITLRA